MLDCSQDLSSCTFAIRLKDDGLRVTHLHAESGELLSNHLFSDALPFACTGMHSVAFDSDSATYSSAASTVRGSPAWEPPRHNTLATARLPRLRCRFAAKGAEEGLRGAVAFGSLEKKRRANAHLPSTDRH